jgi:hypothetical protein
MEPSVENRVEIRRAHRWTNWIPWFLVVALVSANIASVLSVRVHDIVFRTVEAVVATVGGSAAESVLSASPTRIAARERQAIAKASAVARNVAKRTTTRLAVHSAEAVTSIPARVVPFVGAAAVVAMAAYDVRSDCATVAEINEVLSALGAPAEDPATVCKYISKVPSAAEAWTSAKSGAGATAAKVMDLAERVFNRW